MFAWGLKTPLVKPGKIPEGWKPRSKAALPEVRSILKAPLPNLLCFSSSSSICFSWFLEKKLFSMILFKFVLKVKFLSQKYHLLWWHRAWVFGWRAGVASRGQTVRSGAREQKKVFEHMDCMMEKLCVPLTLKSCFRPFFVQWELIPSENYLSRGRE